MSPQTEPAHRRSRLAEDFSAERRLSVADRTRLEQLWNPNTGTVAKLEKRLEQSEEEITKLREWVKYAIGFGSGIAFIAGLAVHFLSHH